MTGAPRVACFVWGARDDQDPYALADIEAFHPGVGFTLNGTTITAETVLSAADKTTRAEYQRAYANRRTRTSADLIPADTWAALSWDALDLTDVAAPTEAGALHLVYDVAHDRQSAGIVACWRDPATSRVRIKAVYHAPGVSWLPDKVAELWAQLRPGKVRAAGNGPVVETTQQLAGRVPVDVLTEHQYAAACGRFLSLVDARALDHDGTRPLAEGIAGLVTRSAITDGVAFSRRASMGDTSLGVAAAIGTWSAATAPTSSGPLFRFGGDTE
jgi:hypothetical protein